MKAFRKLIFWLHLICGVVAGVVVFIMSITGVALTYEKQMLRWAEGYTVEPQAGAVRMGPEALLARVHLETGKPPTGITFDADPTRPAMVLFGREAMAVNPYTGDKLEGGSPKLKAFFSTMIVWHRYLGQEGEGRALGKAITGACNLAFLFIVISGPYLWLPQKWSWQHLRPIVWFRSGLSAKARDFNWHNVAGFWMAVPLFFLVATAVFFSYPWANEALFALTGDPAPSSGSPGGGPRGGARGGGPHGGGPRGNGHGGPSDGKQAEQAPVFAGLDAAWAAAQPAVEGWRTMSLRPPDKPGGPVVIAVDRGGMGVRPDLRSTLTIDSGTGAVVKHEVFADQPTGRRLRGWIRFIHTGEAGGFIGQTLAGVASLAGCLLVYTGFTLSWRRFRAWSARRSRA